MNGEIYRTTEYSMNDIVPLILSGIDGGGEVKLAVKGGSMSPFLTDSRDCVCFSALPKRRLNRGDIVLFRRNDGTYVMHRIYRAEKDGTFTMLGDAQTSLEKNIARTQIVAYVGSVVRKGKTVSCERGFWRRTMSAYMLFRIRFPRVAKFVHLSVYRVWVLLHKKGEG